ncbi:MAG: hypothetical protein AAFN77_20065 [Planctomycetota bacterium]
MPSDTTADPIVISEQTNSASKPFVGKWNQLVSTTNWEKGEIICNWRKQLEDKDVKSTEYSDDAWSQLVGGVTPQHVGRLRRTFERFGHVYGEYDGVFWSHFYAALDWDDAEMWLEGAVQNKWSVSAMRKQRWETLGQVGEEPTEPIVSSELEEETQSLALSEEPRNNDRDYVQGPVHEGPDWGDEDQPGNKSSSSKSESTTDESDESVEEPAKPHAIRPFESFTDLPDDVMDAAGAFKVAIIRHKAAEWEEISQDDMLGMLDALKQLASIAAE